jgi:hypothetical protein
MTEIESTGEHLTDAERREKAIRHLLERIEACLEKLERVLAESEGE